MQIIITRLEYKEKKQGFPGPGFWVFTGHVKLGGVKMIWGGAKTRFSDSQIHRFTN